MITRTNRSIRFIFNPQLIVNFNQIYPETTGHPVKVRRVLQGFRSSVPRPELGKVLLASGEQKWPYGGCFTNFYRTSSFTVRVNAVLRRGSSFLSPHLLWAAASGIATLGEISCVNRYYKSNKIMITRSYPESIQCHNLEYFTSRFQQIINSFLIILRQELTHLQGRSNLLVCKS